MKFFKLILLSFNYILDFDNIFLLFLHLILCDETFKKNIVNLNYFFVKRYLDNSSAPPASLATRL